MKIFFDTPPSYPILMGKSSCIFTTNVDNFKTKCRTSSVLRDPPKYNKVSPMNRKDIIDLYSDDEPGILFADGYDKAIAGVIWDGERTRVVYTTEKILAILMERDAMSYDEASEFFDFNVAGSHMGVYTPLYLET